MKTFSIRAITKNWKGIKTAMDSSFAEAQTQEDAINEYIRRFSSRYPWGAVVFAFHKGMEPTQVFQYFGEIPARVEL